jgi:hypothetical protein
LIALLHLPLCEHAVLGLLKMKRANKLIVHPFPRVGRITLDAPTHFCFLLMRHLFECDLKKSQPKQEKE